MLTRYLKANKHSTIIGIVIIITALLGIFVILSPPGLYPDPSHGFQVLRSMQMGGEFNMLVSPSQDNITLNTSEFLTWWSPGQYLLPYLFKTLFGLKLGQAIGTTILFCYLIGLWGFYSLFRKLGFSKNISALSIAFIACQQFYILPFVFYNGGETLLFAFLGWFLYGCFSFKQINWQLIVFVVLSGWLGFFCKSAFLWMYASGLCCLWITISRKKNNWVTWLKNGALIAIPAMIALAGIYKFFLSKGQNPASSATGLHLSLEAFSFPLASPLLSGFSVDDLFHGLVYRNAPPLFSLTVMLLILVALALISIALIVTIIRFVPDNKYRILLVVFYSASILFFTLVFLKQAAISYEARHFRIVGLLTIPGAMYMFTKAQKQIKTVLILLWAGIGIMSMSFLFLGCKYNLTKCAHGPSGIAQEYIDQPTLNYLQTLDKQSSNAVFVFTSPDIGLDITHNRIINIEPVNANYNMEDYEYDGHAGHLYILLPASYINNGKYKLVQQYFPGYGNFTAKRLSKNYVVYSAE